MHPNVYKILTNKNIPYSEIRHDSFNLPINSPVDFALALGYDLGRITKAVFLRSKSRDKYIMAVCSVDKKLDLVKLALLSQTNKLEVADRQELANIIGYPPTGVSPIGIPASVEIFIDNSLSLLPGILIGAGETGVEIEMSPGNLVKCLNTPFHNITL